MLGPENRKIGNKPKLLKPTTEIFSPLNVHKQGYFYYFLSKARMIICKYLAYS